MSKSLEMLTMLLVLGAELLSFTVTKVWFKDREKGSKDIGESFFFQPSTSYLTRQCTFVPSMLISLTLKVLVEKKVFLGDFLGFSHR